MQARNDNLAGRRVLVIEDESLVAMFIRDTLEDIGCQVEASAYRFDDALQKVKSLVFDIAILDVNLNGRQSFPIAEALVERGMPFVFATGYAKTSLPANFQWVPVLHKPFQRRDLEWTLEAALRRRNDAERSC